MYFPRRLIDAAGNGSMARAAGEGRPKRPPAPFLTDQEIADWLAELDELELYFEFVDYIDFCELLGAPRHLAVVVALRATAES